MEMSAQRSLAAIVFTDAVGFSAVASADEKRALELIEADHRVFRDVCERNNGEVVKTMGDGMLMVFSSAVEALDASVEIHRFLSERSADNLRHRIGVHVGDMYLTEDDVKGEGVNVAARLQAGAPANGIWVSGAVYELVRSRYSGRLAPIGSKSLRNITEPVSVYEYVPDGAHRPAPLPRSSKTTWVAAAGLGAVALAAFVLSMGSWRPERAKMVEPDVVSRVEPAATEPKIELTQEQWAAIVQLLSRQANETQNPPQTASQTSLVEPSNTSTAATKPTSVKESDSDRSAAVKSGVAPGAGTRPSPASPEVTSSPAGAKPTPPAPPKRPDEGSVTVEGADGKRVTLAPALPKGLDPKTEAEIKEAFAQIDPEKFERDFAEAFRKFDQSKVRPRGEHPAESLMFLKRGYEFQKLSEAYQAAGAASNPAMREELKRLGELSNFRRDLTETIRTTKDLTVSTNSPGIQKIHIRDGKVFAEFRSGKETYLPFQALQPWQIKVIGENLAKTNPKLETGLKTFSQEFGLKKE